MPLITIQQGFVTTVHAQTMWISWSEDTVLTLLEQLYYVATAAAHMYLRTIIWFYRRQKQNSRKVSFTRCAQLQSADRAPAQNFKHGSPVKPAQQTGAKGAYQSITGGGGKELKN